MPLYKELLKTPEGTARAKAIYAKARPFYHPIAAESVDKRRCREPLKDPETATDARAAASPRP